MRILFVYHRNMSSFIRQDLDILRKRHQVRVVRFSTIADAYTIWRGTYWCDLTFSWFGGEHAFFAVLFSKISGKKSVVVAGGYDVARLPEISYGLFCHWWKRWLPLIVFRSADRILTVSQSNTEETLRNTKASAHKITLVYHGFDSDGCKPEPHCKREPLVLTAGNVCKLTLTKKGLDLFVRASRLLPQVEFILAGRWLDDSITYVRTIAPCNMKFIGEVDHQELFRIMSRARVYVQVSRHESFGCALAEAMLCECIPVVTKFAALPEVVGDCGFYLTRRDPEELAALISKALSADVKLGVRARERVKTLFTLQKRQEALLQTVEQLTR